MVKGKITTLIASALVLLSTTLNAEESRQIQWWSCIRQAVYADRPETSLNTGIRSGTEIRMGDNS